MKPTVFKGAATALITPLNENGIDFEKMGALIEWQIESGINALVVCGTTGEKSTLGNREHKELIEFCVSKIAGRVPLIAGTGSNDTEYGLDMTRHACKSGADAVLVVTPYYNKATQAGLIKSFYKYADESTKPVILYNVPSRTGCNIQPETAAKLAEHPNICAIKEASGDLSQIADIASRTEGNLDIYSGTDENIVPVLSLGGKGVISVLSNICPTECVRMCESFFEGKIEESRELQLHLFPLIKKLFCEVNPIPVKAALSAMGFCENYLRLPLTPMEEQNRKELLLLMRENGIKV